ncbi:hypothetical protein [Mesorhizobium sp. L-8-3]|uniref:hypothetical protein n=1 Tax=Mesorhizobium sp. L-8-3 TaxID=2744522 RepID=UPI0019264643|nr:hypothetical protein [Mesorhizobium sp. L-8-3]BCH23545.1 hypothetical protein MesoLjLb_33300 [Mesorhizobium sp. L-8-3]
MGSEQNRETHEFVVTDVQLADETNEGVALMLTDARSAARKTSSATAQSVSVIFVDIADLQNQSAFHESDRIPQIYT